MSKLLSPQAPAKAAIYGIGEGPVSVTVSGSDGAGAAVLYTVAAFAAVDDGTLASGSAAAPTWKAFLKPAAAGGSYTVSAKGAGGTLVLERVTFGDVYFCSGPSTTNASWSLQRALSAPRGNGWRLCRGLERGL